MSTPALEVTHDRGATAEALDVCPGGSAGRPMICAAAVSALLHALLFLTIGLASFRSPTSSSAPELQLYVEPAHGLDTENDLAGPVEQAAAPIHQPREEVLASPAGMHSLTVRSPSGTAARNAPPKPDDTRTEPPTPSAADSSSEPVSPTGSEQSDSPAVAEAVVTTVGPSEREEPLQEEAAKPQEPGVPIGNAQETVLTRWILQAAHGLQDANLTQARLSLRHDGREYTAFLEREPAADDMGIDRVRAEITTEENGKRFRTLLELKRLACSHFAQLVDYWDREDQLHADAIEGRFHSNSEVQIRFDRFAPRVLGKLTTAASRVNVENGGPGALRQMFLGGVETNTPRIALSADFPSFIHDRADPAKVHTLARSTRVTFHPDGSYGWQELGSNAPEQRQTLSTPQYIVASRGVAVAVRGTVSGIVVVYSPEQIIVEGSLVYAHDPRSDPDAGDYLGLISSKDIEIAPPRVTGPGDLEIQAAIYARRRFIVTDDHSLGGPTACPCAATLSIWGSVTAGSLSPTEPRYATRYEFDRRFERVRPPGFPVTNRYEVEGWDAEWRVADADLPAGAPEATSEPTAPPQG